MSWDTWNGIVNGYLVATLVIAVLSSYWRLDEVVALLTWPVSIPLAGAVRWWRRHRATCNVCGLRWADRSVMEQHRASAHAAPVGSS